VNNLLNSPRASIDLGGQKIACLIAEGDSKEKVCVRGFGSALSHGVFLGQLDDIGLLKRSLMSAVCEAEMQARKRVRQANLTLSGGFFKSEHALLRSSIAHAFVHEKDVQDMVNRIKRPGLLPIHIIPLYFSVDQQKNIQNPCGMAGESLVGHFHILWSQENTMKTLRSFFKDCNIRLNHIVAGCFSDSLFCFDEDERSLGITLVNIGAHYTTASIFIRGNLYDQVTIPMGGHDMTEDIARAYGIKVVYAEKIKIAFGAALINLEHYHRSIPLLSSKEKMQSDFSISYTSLVDVIQARCEKIISRLKKGMGHSPHFHRTSSPLYLTGGGSHLIGIGELFQRLFGQSVRVVSPRFPEKIHNCSNGMTSAMGGLFYQDVLFGGYSQPKKNSLIGQHHKTIKPFFSWIKKLC